MIVILQNLRNHYTVQCVLLILWISILSSCSDISSDALMEDKDLDYLELSLYLRHATDSVTYSQNTKKADTLSPGDSLFLHARITPTATRVVAYFWTLDSGKIRKELSFSQTYTTPGVYRPKFTAIDNWGDTLQDSLSIVVDVSPRIEQLNTPPDNAPGLAVKPIPSGTYFSWEDSDENPERLQRRLQVFSNPALKDSTLWLDTVLYANEFQWNAELAPLQEYYWRVILIDQYLHTDTSETYRFSTSSSDGVLAGVKGILRRKDSPLTEGLSIVLQNSWGYNHKQHTDSLGVFKLDSLVPGTWVLKITDTLNPEYQTAPDTLEILTGQLRLLDTLELQDTIPPEIELSDESTINPQSATLFFQVSDSGSGLDLSTIDIRINNQNYTDLTTASETFTEFLELRLPGGLPSGQHQLRLKICDQSLNCAEKFTSLTSSLSHITPPLPKDTAVAQFQSLSLDLYMPQLGQNLIYAIDKDNDGLFEISQSNPIFEIEVGTDTLSIAYHIRNQAMSVSFHDTLQVFPVQPPLVPVILYPQWQTDVFSYESLRWNSAKAPGGDSLIFYSVYFYTEPESIYHLYTDSLTDTTLQLKNFPQGITAVRIEARDQYNQIKTFSTVFRILWSPPAGNPMKLAEPGTFTDSAGNQAVISTPLWVDSTEITRNYYNLILQQITPADSGHYPQTNITWAHAILFANARSNYYNLDTVYSYTAYDGEKFTDLNWNPNTRGFRLPTLDEWQYLARNRLNQVIPNHYNSTDCYAGNQNNCLLSPQPVADYLPISVFELYDMDGNVSEWVWDSDLAHPRPDGRTDYYTPAHNTDSAHLAAGASWNEPGYFAQTIQKSNAETSPNIGLRFVLPNTLQVVP